MRITVTVAVLLLAAAVGVACIAYRASHAPAWYTAAIDCPTAPAHDAEQTELIGFQNWLARSGAGDPNQLPEAQRRYEITLSSDQINALLAKWTDNLHGDIDTFRVRLGDDEITLEGTWTARGRVIGLTLKSAPAQDGRPAVAIDSFHVGEQGVPLKWVNAKPIAKLKSELASLAASDKPIAIDEHGVATPHAARAYTVAALLALANGSSIEPVCFVSPRLSIEDTIPLDLVAIRSDGKQLTLTFRLLSPGEQQVLLDEINADLAAAK